MSKPWNESRGPIVSTDIDVQKADAIQALLVRRVGILPSEIGMPIKPFAVGLFDELRPLLKPDVSATTLRRAVAASAHSKRYYFASAQPDAMRHDVGGNPVEPVSLSDRLLAQSRFEILRQKLGEGLSSGR